MVPEIRNDGYSSFFIESKKPSDTALMNVIQEAYVKGVSTRKIDKLTKTSGVESISRSQVSAITKDLNQQVKTMAVIVSIGITTERKWDISALELMCEKSTATYIHVFDRLKKRGVEQVYL